MTEITALSATAASQIPKRDQALWKVAQELEASFLAEMLKSAGMGSARDNANV